MKKKVGCNEIVGVTCKSYGIGTIIIWFIINYPEEPSIDVNIVKQLCDMGFAYESCRKAVYFTNNDGMYFKTYGGKVVSYYYCNIRFSISNIRLFPIVRD